MFWRGAVPQLQHSVLPPYTSSISRTSGRPSVVLQAEHDVYGTDGAHRVQVRKEIVVDGSRLNAGYHVRNLSAVPAVSNIAIETNWALTDPAAAVLIDGHALPVRDLHDIPQASSAAFRDSGWDAPVMLKISPARLWLLPMWTVSNSEAGFERIFQGLTCVMLWPLSLDPEQTWEIEMSVYLPGDAIPEIR